MYEREKPLGHRPPLISTELVVPRLAAARNAGKRWKKALPSDAPMERNANAVVRAILVSTTSTYSFAEFLRLVPPPQLSRAHWLERWGDVIDHQPERREVLSEWPTITYRAYLVITLSSI